MIKRSDIPEAEIVEACRAYHRHEAPSPDKALAHKYPVKVIFAKMDQMEGLGLLNFGGSLRTAWVEEAAWEAWQASKKEEER